MNLHNYAGAPVNIETFGHEVAVIPAEDVKNIIKSGEFDYSVLFFQTVLIHTWFTKVKSNN